MGSLLQSFLSIILFVILLCIIYLNSKDREKIQKLEDKISSMEDLINLKNQEIVKKRQEIHELTKKLDQNDSENKEFINNINKEIERE